MNQVVESVEMFDLHHRFEGIRAVVAPTDPINTSEPRRAPKLSSVELSVQIRMVGTIMVPPSSFVCLRTVVSVIALIER